MLHKSLIRKVCAVRLSGSNFTHGFRLINDRKSQPIIFFLLKVPGRSFTIDGTIDFKTKESLKLNDSDSIEDIFIRGVELIDDDEDDSEDIEIAKGAVVHKVNGRKKKESLREEKQSSGINLLTAAAGLGHKRAMCLLGNILTPKENKVEDRRKGISWYEKAAEEPSPLGDALFNLGNMYFLGDEEAGITVDLPRSLTYFQRAADLGDGDAILWLGHCYETGEGGIGEASIDIGQAVTFFKRAVDAGNCKAYFRLALLSLSHTDFVLTEYKEIPPTYKSPFLYFVSCGVQAEDADALFCLADLRMLGSTEHGVEVDQAAAKVLYERAAADGHTKAALCLGVMHYSGLGGLAKNPTKAFEMYSIAAEKGSMEAWRNIASMYFTGDGVEKNEQTAKEIVRLILKNGEM